MKRTSALVFLFLHMGNRLPGYSGEKLPSKFKPGEEE